MYRDANATLDERDRAVGAILIAEALLASCERARVLGRDDEPEAWRAIRDAHDEFPEIWRSLDRARRELARRGINVIGYDELRPHVRTRLATTTPADDTDAVRVDPSALDDARRATDELKLAVPGTDWAAIDRRTSGLVHAPLIRRRHRVAMIVAMVVFSGVMLAWFAALVPGRPIDRRHSLRRAIARIVQVAEHTEIAEQRRARILELQRSIGERCDPGAAHDLTRELMMDGRGVDARAFAAGYCARCGDDEMVLRWANAPLP